VVLAHFLCLQFFLLKSLFNSHPVDNTKHSPRKAENEGSSGPRSPFTELFGEEGEGNDFEARVKGGNGIVRRSVSTGGDTGYGSSSDEDEEEEEEEKEKDDGASAHARRGRTSSTSVPIEETPLGKSDEEN